MPEKQPKIVLVEWEDASYSGNYDEQGLITMSTVGYIVANTDRYVTVAQDWMDGRWRNSSTIPWSGITKITDLRKETKTTTQRPEVR